MLFLYREDKFKYNYTVNFGHKKSVKGDRDVEFKDEKSPEDKEKLKSR